MNNSGIAVKEIKEFYNIDIQNIYVIHDEIDLDCGQIKIKNGGGHNGHNGLRSIDQSIGKGYNRIRVGVSRPSKLYEKNINENISNWVLSDFTSEDSVKWLDNAINKISEDISLLIEKNTNTNKN
jgi:PTH1 family peptidyl-tRNA hydrolase